MENSENTRNRKKRKVNGTRILLIISYLLVLVLSAALVLVLIFYRRPLEPEVEEALAPVTVVEEENLTAQLALAKEEGHDEAVNEYKTDLKDYLMSGESLIDKLRDMYPDDVIYYDNSQYVFAPIVDSVPKNSYSNTDLIALESGEMQYAPGGTVTSIKGIDVSKYQGKINWTKVAASGIEYAILRVGIRGYGSGALVLDDTFEYNLKNATAAGLDVGVYFFTQAISEEEAREEARFVMDAIKGYNITYPIVIDVEVVKDSEARTYNLTQEERTNYCIAFCEEVRSARYTPMIYGNLKSLIGMLDISRLNEYGKWFAYYDSDIYFPYEIDMWQYTDTATVDGIDGPVDLNITFGPLVP